MRVFCEHLTKGMSKVAAARAAGCTQNTATVTASRWMTLPQVQAYLNSLGRAGKEILAERLLRAEALMAPALAGEKTRHEAKATVRRQRMKAMELADIIESLSDEAHADMGNYLSFYPTLDAEGKPLPPGDDGKVPGHVDFDLEKAVREGTTHLIREIKMGKFGWEIKLVDRQQAKVALAKIRGYIDPDEKDAAARNLQQWATALAELLRQARERGAAPITARDLYLSHMARRPIDVQASLVEGDGNGHGGG